MSKLDGRIVHCRCHGQEVVSRRHDRPVYYRYRRYIRYRAGQGRSGRSGRSGSYGKVPRPSIGEVLPLVAAKVLLSEPKLLRLDAERLEEAAQTPCRCQRLAGFDGLAPPLGPSAIVATN